MAENSSTLNQSCAQCGGSFIPNRVDARFCSNKCRQRAYRRRVTASTAAETRCCDEAQPTPTHPESNAAVERGNTAAKAVTANNEKKKGKGIDRGTNSHGGEKTGSFSPSAASSVRKSARREAVGDA